MTSRIAIVGEAWGAEEEAQRLPFVGASGYELTRMLSEAGIHRADCFLTNVFNLRPERNDIETLCTDKASGLVDLGPLARGKFLHPRYAPELERLAGELAEVRPNIVIALGNTPAWAVLGLTGITKIRGTVALGTRPAYLRQKVLPTFHPAAVLREWSNRHVTVLDLAKAERESHFPELRRPECTVYIEPSLADLEWFFNEYLIPAPSISFDIETSGNQITCIGFAPSREVAIVVPFVDTRATNPEHKNSYWPTREEEVAAWEFVRRVLALPQPKFGQNTLYDIHFLWRGYGIPVVNYADDTMLLHHALHPEAQKGLGFMGSVYTNHASWKTMRVKTKTIKRDN